MVVHLPLLRNLSRVLFYSVTDLIAGWGHYGTNNRRALLDTRLLYDAPMGILFADCIQELARI
jgi:hypothetical protein